MSIKDLLLAGYGNGGLTARLCLPLDADNEFCNKEILNMINVIESVKWAQIHQLIDAGVKHNFCVVSVSGKQWTDTCISRMPIKDECDLYYLDDLPERVTDFLNDYGDTELMVHSHILTIGEGEESCLPDEIITKLYDLFLDHPAYEMSVQEFAQGGIECVESHSFTVDADMLRME